VQLKYFSLLSTQPQKSGLDNYSKQLSSATMGNMSYVMTNRIHSVLLNKLAFHSVAVEGNYRCLW